MITSVCIDTKVHLSRGGSTAINTAGQEVVLLCFGDFTHITAGKRDYSLLASLFHYAFLALEGAESHTLDL